jgi:hypothetical protein
MKALQLLDLSIGPDLHELTKHGTPVFPCAGYDEDPGKYWRAASPGTGMRSSRSFSPWRAKHA